jgi:hypothetical protein
MTLVVAVVCDRMLGKRSEAPDLTRHKRASRLNRNAPYQSIRGIFYGRLAVSFSELTSKGCESGSEPARESQPPSV